MAVRHATLDLTDFQTFLREAKGSLASGAIFLPAGTVEGELAPEFRLDLILPLVGRFGPLKGQIIQRSPDGGVAARLPETGKLQEGLDKVWAGVEGIKDFLLAEGSVVLPGQNIVYQTIDEDALVEDTMARDLDEATEDPDDDYEEVEETVEGPAGGLRAGYALPEGLDREPDAAGSCEDRSLRDQLVELAATEATGVLTLLAADGTKLFGFWLNGGPVGWRSDPLNVAWTVGGLLKNSGRLEEARRLRSLEVMEEEDCRQGEALVKMGVLGQGSIGALLRKQAEFLLQAALRERQGIWAFHAVAQHVEPFSIEPVAVPDVLYRAMLDFSKNVSTEGVYARLKTRLDSHINLLPTVEPLLARFDFNEREQRFLTLLRSDPPLRVRKVFSLTPLTKADTAGTIWALEEMGMLSFGAETDQDSETRIRRLAGPLLKKSQAVDGANLFDVLEVHWICTPADVDKAYKGLSKRWDRGIFGRVPGELAEALERIEGRLTEARSVLTDADKRRSYREELVGREMVSKCAAFIAEKGTSYTRAEDRPMALRCYHRAVELEPANESFQEGLLKAEKLKRVFKKGG